MNAFYCPKKPEIEAAILPGFHTSRAFGGAVKAIRKYSCAEGYESVSDGDYSHAEGYATFTGGTGSHAEGYGNYAIGKFSHAEGGWSGDYIKDSGNYAIGNSGHVEGDGFNYAGTYRFEIISADSSAKTITLRDSSGLSAGLWIAVGYKAMTSMDSLFNTAITEISGNTITVNQLPFKANLLSDDGYIFAPEYPMLGGPKRTGAGAHAEGQGNIANMHYSHAEGYGNYAVGKFSHCHGIKNKAGWCSTAIGKGNSAYGFESIAMGCTNVGGGTGGAEYDSNCVVRSQFAFAWSGNGQYVISGSGKKGAFCINPQNGISGFYIGQQNFPEAVSSAISGMFGNLEEIIDNL